MPTPPAIIQNGVQLIGPSADGTSGQFLKTDGSKNLSFADGGGHTQNTDTGTTSQTFQLQSGSSGVKLKNNAGAFEVRNAADSAMADLSAKKGTFDDQINIGGVFGVGTQLTHLIDQKLTSDTGIFTIDANSYCNFTGIISTNYVGFVGTGGTSAKFTSLTNGDAVPRIIITKITSGLSDDGVSALQVDGPAKFVGTIKPGTLDTATTMGTVTGQLCSRLSDGKTCEWDGSTWQPLR